MTRVHDRERGSTLILVMILLTALGAGAAIAISVQLADTRTVGYTRQTRDSMYCAEAGLVVARKQIGESYLLWDALLDADPANDPTWYPLRGDVGDGGDSDWIVTVRDNDDEFPPAPNDLTRDGDDRLFIVARCTKYPETPREILELVSYSGGGTAYRNQAGQGAGNTGNAN